MAVVSNTSPILNLAVVNQLHLLRQQFTEMIIPPAVQAELFPDAPVPGSESIRQALDEGWIHVAEQPDEPLSRALALELDQGEAAAIALATKLGITTILMDERDGRMRARVLGLETVGVLGILLRAKFDGAIEAVAPVLTALREEAGFFIADDLAAAVLAEAGEESA